MRVSNGRAHRRKYALTTRRKIITEWCALCAESGNERSESDIVYVQPQSSRWPQQRQCAPRWCHMIAEVHAMICERTKYIYLRFIQIYMVEWFFQTERQKARKWDDIVRRRAWEQCTEHKKGVITSTQTVKGRRGCAVCVCVSSADLGVCVCVRVSARWMPGSCMLF